MFDRKDETCYLLCSRTGFQSASLADVIDDTGFPSFTIHHRRPTSTQTNDDVETLAIAKNSISTTLIADL